MPSGISFLFYHQYWCQSASCHIISQCFEDYQLLCYPTIQFGLIEEWKCKSQALQSDLGKPLGLLYTAHKMWDSSRREEATWFVCDGLSLGSDMKTKRLKGESWKQKWASFLLWYEIQIWRVECAITQFS